MGNNIIGSYSNGNTFVVIYEDGTKVRTWPDGERPAPVFPESMDLKITARCTGANCPVCAECSTPDGKHADLNHPILDTIHPYTELAIGGGNPLEHPDLEAFLTRMKERNVICNLTVNILHFLGSACMLKRWTDGGLIHGLGVSIPSYVVSGSWRFYRYTGMFPNLVVHTIAGYTPKMTYDELAGKDLNLLVLGFKDKGRGSDYLHSGNGNVARRIQELADHILSMRSEFRGIAFDNLAVEQLGLKDRLPAGDFDRLYMGGDGQFTMYLDLVSEQYAASSTHPPRPIDRDTIEELFREVQA